MIKVCFCSIPSFRIHFGFIANTCQCSAVEYIVCVFLFKGQYDPLHVHLLGDESQQSCISLGLLIQFSSKRALLAWETCIYIAKARQNKKLQIQVKCNKRRSIQRKYRKYALNIKYKLQMLTLKYVHK